MAKQRTPVPAGPSARRKARNRRLYSTILWWIFVVLFTYNAIVLGQAFFWVPAVVFGAGAVATTRLALSPRAPERHTPEPGELAAARKGRVVEVDASWVAREGGRPQPARRGQLRVTDGRLAFTADEGGGFEAPIKRLRTATVPSFLRPQLDLEVDGDVHTIRFFAMWDLGATFVGPVVAMEWYRQLRALGAA